MKEYTFVNEKGETITTVKAEDHDQALINVNLKGIEGITRSTDFYSETIEGGK